MVAYQKINSAFKDEKIFIFKLSCVYGCRFGYFCVCLQNKR
jgi:hypothetical protein